MLHAKDSSLIAYRQVCTAEKVPGRRWQPDKHRDREALLATIERKVQGMAAPRPRSRR